MSELNLVFKVTDRDEILAALAGGGDMLILVDGDPARPGDCVLKVKVGGHWSLPIAELEVRWAAAAQDRQWNDPGSGPGW